MLEPVFRGMRTYMTDAWSELKKVAWPTRQTVVNLTLIVIAVSTAVGAYIAVLDLLLKGAVDQVL
ncbi:MAG TPA: preprotein translocase subunit SecE [Candidatus Limnocylindria bacterium]|nr:preprotein translocase subunit SecE [Candidatus Limnocylindria bacterium]